MKTPRIWALLQAISSCALALSVAPAAAAPVSLFNGTNLDGWTTVGGNATYAVQNGEIVGTANGGSNTFLITDTTHADFVLELDFKVDADMNSGVQFRSNLRQPNDVVFGYQIEIDASSRAWTGGLYDEQRRGWLDDMSDNAAARAAFVAGGWNHFKIVAEGRRLRSWLNGVAAADYTDASLTDFTPSGFIGLQVHGGGVYSGKQVRWDNITIDAVPGPGAVAIAAVGATGLLRRRRRRG